MKLSDLVEIVTVGLIVVIAIGGAAVLTIWLPAGVVGTRLGRTRPVPRRPLPPKGGYDHEAAPGDPAEPLITITPWQNTHGADLADEDFPAAYWDALPGRKDKR